MKNGGENDGVVAADEENERETEGDENEDE